MDTAPNNKFQRATQVTCKKIAICVLCCMVIFLQSCRTITQRSISEIGNGPFKVMVRTQEFNHSGTDIVDICVANSSSHEFPDKPDKTSQYFLNGYDFEALSVKWKGPDLIEVSFHSGRVTHFKNTAFAYPGGPVPHEFLTRLCDGCEPEPKYTHAGDVKR
jgi:hypothetical protein